MGEVLELQKNLIVDYAHCTIHGGRCEHDNKGELFENFRIHRDKKYVQGYAWVHKCGGVCRSVEHYLPCANAYITVKVVCCQCGARWRYKKHETTRIPIQ